MAADAGTGRHLTVLKPGKSTHRSDSGYRLSPELLAANLVIAFERMDERAHPFFGMRSQLLRYAWETGQRIFAVTSVEPGDGKTHVAANLAAAISRIAPTVLVELDLRRPSIKNRLGISSCNPGIDDFLGGEASIDDTMIRVRGFDLAIHLVGRTREAPERLLASPRLTAFFDHIRSREEQPICIVDAPPALIDDVMLIKEVIDGAILVVEEGRTTKRALLAATRALGPTPVVGTVLNKSLWNMSSGISYGYYGRHEERLTAGEKI